MIDVNSLRPSGIKRKIMKSESIVTTSAANNVIGYFPHGAKLISIGWLAFAAQSANASATTLDIGVASGGDTIIDGFALTDSKGQGLYTEMINTPGTNGGTRTLDAGATLWCETITADADGGAIQIIVEYEDNSD